MAFGLPFLLSRILLHLHHVYRACTIYQRGLKEYRDTRSRDLGLSRTGAQRSASVLDGMCRVRAATVD